jgi:hypothetical protein
MALIFLLSIPYVPINPFFLLQFQTHKGTGTSGPATDSVNLNTHEKPMIATVSFVNRTNPFLLPSIYSQFRIEPFDNDSRADAVSGSNLASPTRASGYKYSVQDGYQNQTKTLQLFHKLMFHNANNRYSNNISNLDTPRTKD